MGKKPASVRSYISTQFELDIAANFQGSSIYFFSSILFLAVQQKP